ncbi:MAG TPA: ABC transporter permease [Bacteroidales bacterium]|nr:ABC transporter permease [Bacteroidales bacterium]
MKEQLKNTIRRINSGFLNTLKIWLREYQVIFTDVGVLIVMIAAPLVYPVLYSLIYKPEIITDMPIAIVDLSRSADSRQFSRQLDATQELRVAYMATSMTDAIKQFKLRNVRGIIEIPSSFSKDIAQGNQTNISAYADMEFFLYYKTLLLGTSFVTLETGKQIQFRNLVQQGETLQEADAAVNPIHIEDTSIANAVGGFATYAIPVALMLIIQQTLILAIGIMAGTARERHARGTLVPLDKNKMGTFRLVIGKSAAYFTVYALLCVYLLGIIPQMFGYYRLADFKELAALMTPFLLSCIFFGMTLSVLFKNRESPMLLFLFTSFPLFFLSGIIWPLSNFSNIWLIVREIFPSSNAVFGYIKMNTLGASITETSHEITALWIQTGVYFLTACLVYYVQVKLSERKNKEIKTFPINSIKQKLAGRLSGNTIATTSGVK